MPEETSRDPKKMRFQYTGGALFLDKEGHWFHEGVEITHKLTADLFSRSIKKDPEGGYCLEIGLEWAPVEVEDTPFMVRRVDFDGQGAKGVLNDGSEESIDMTTLRITAENVLYCDVKGGEYPARFLRPAYYQITQGLVESEEGFAIRTGNGTYPIREVE